MEKYRNPLLAGESRCYNIITCWKSPLVLLCKATFARHQHSWTLLT